jgi:nucleoside-diphosphate-sugar epimerase
MKAFITGGTGFIGSHLIDYYLSGEEEAELHVLVRDPHNLNWLAGRNIHVVKGNLFSIPSLPSDIDCVFHLAGLTLASDLADYYTVNQLGTASLFQSLHTQKISPQRVVFLSSLSAVGPSLNCSPVKETSPPHPITPYGLSKLKGEQEALKFKDVFPTIILRAPAVFGPRDRDFLQYFRLIKRRILPILCGKRRLLSLCYVKDLARAIDLIIQQDTASGEVFNIADPKPYGWDEFGKTAGNVMGKSLISLKIPDFLLSLVSVFSQAAITVTQKTILLNPYKIKEMKEKCWIADVTKAQEKLAFSPQYTLGKALQETIDWYIQHKWL